MEIDMFAGTVKASICVLVAVLLLSVMLPAGAGTSSQGMNHLSGSSPGNGQDINENNLPSILALEEPKVLYMVEGENGEKFLIDMPQDSEKETIENRIEEVIEEDDIQNEELIEDMQEQEEEKIEENESGDSEENPDQEEPIQIMLHRGWFSGSLDGYLFCDVNETLHFDASYLFCTYPVLKYEWDFDGDGLYEVESLSPMISYGYCSIGLYNMRVKITYSYYYSYYPYNIYPSFTSDSAGYKFDVNVDSQSLASGEVQVNIDEGVDSTPLTFTVENDVDTVSPTVIRQRDFYSRPTMKTVQKSLEYEITVSVGSKEYGYPPILDFEFEAGYDVEEAYKKSPIVTFQPSIPFPTVQVMKPIIPIVIPFIEPFVINESSKPSKIYVRMSEVEHEVVIPDLNDCVVEFDASETKNPNGESKLFWDFGDKEYGNGMNVTHTYRKKGTYTATLYIDGWDCSISKTFVILRGSEDPRLVVISNQFGSDDYFLCKVNEQIRFDISTFVGWNNFAWCEWDFNGDGFYEYNTTSKIITKKFEEPGYFEVSFRYTYTSTYQFYFIWQGSSTRKENQEQPIRYYTNTYWLKVAVANQDNVYPPIPDFYVRAPESFSWWNGPILWAQINEDVQINEQDHGFESRLKNVTFLTAFSSYQWRLNSWNSTFIFNASSTINFNSPNLDELTFHWDFGDGTTATGMEVTHTYLNNAIDYEVKLTVQDEIYNVTINRMIVPRPYSPNIYLYRETPGYDTIKVIVDGRVTKAVPEVELGSEIIWEDVWIMGGKLYYKGKSHDFLYYEEEIEPRTSEYGWILERDERGRLFLNDEMVTLKELKEFFGNELKKAGLYEHEIEDFVDEWLGEGGRLFPGQKVFRYAIMYVPEEVVEDIIQIETEKDYDEIIRVHFLVQPAAENIRLKPPIYPQHKSGKNVLHEWGVYVGESELSNGKSKTYFWWSLLVDDYEALKMNGRRENKVVGSIIEFAVRGYDVDPLFLNRPENNITYWAQSKVDQSSRHLKQNIITTNPYPG